MPRHAEPSQAKEGRAEERMLCELHETVKPKSVRIAHLFLMSLLTSAVHYSQSAHERNRRKSPARVP
jgi:hypothetical protein